MSRSAKTPTERRRLVARWRASGEPLTRFARAHDIHPRTLWGWVHEAQAVDPPGPTFVPVQVVDQRADDRGESDARLEIILPAGTIVRVRGGASPVWVSTMVRALRATC
jgi:transposase-like protein